VNAVAAAAVLGELGSLGPGGRGGELRLGRRKVEETLEELAAGRKGKLAAAAGLGVGGGLAWAGASVRRGQGRRLPFKATSAPPRDRRTGGGRAWGRARPDDEGTDPWSFACAYEGSGCEAFPAFEASGGEP
jgi:hypothetical protein